MTSSLSTLPAASLAERAADAILVTPANFADAVRGLPFTVRRAFGYALKLERGRLIAILPSGKALAFQAASRDRKRPSSSTTCASHAASRAGVISDSPRPICTANGTRPISPASSNCSA